MDDRTAVKPTWIARARDGVARIVDGWFTELPPGEAFERGELPPTLAQQKRLTESVRLSQFLPFESYDPARRLYHNVDSLGFLLEAAPATGLDEARLNVLTGLVTQGVRNQTTIQISLYGDPDIHPLLDAWEQARQQVEGAQAAALRGLARRRIDYLRGGAWKSLFSDQPLVVRNWRVFVSFQRPRLSGSAPDPGEMDYLIRTRESYKSSLQSAGLLAAEVEPEDLIRLFDGLLNPTDQPRAAFRYDPNQLLREQMVDRDSLLLVGRDGLGLIHEHWHTTVLPYSVRQYPTTWAGWANGELLGSLTNNALRYPCPVLITQTIHAADQVEALNAAKMKSARATQMVDAPIGRYVPAWKDRKKDWDFVIQNVNAGHTLLQVGYQILAYAPRGEEEHCEQKLKAVYESRGWGLQKDRFSALHAFRAALPMSGGPQFVSELKKMGYLRTLLTWSAINTAPLIGEWRGTGQPLLLLVGRRGQIQFVDPFDNKKGNYNIACAATSGSGKSFLSQETIVALLSTGGRCWVFDAGRSYQNINGQVGGAYIEFSKNTTPVLNPFDGIIPEEFADEALPMVKQILAQMASPTVALDSLHLSYLEQAIQRAWVKHERGTEITEVAYELEQASSTEERNLAVMLYPWTRKGSNGRFFSGKSNVNLDNPFVVLELDDLNARPDLQSVVMMILMMRITETMYLLDRNQRKLCIIDEAWRLLGGGNAGGFIETGYRTARKYGGAFMTITQGIDDYYKSAGAKAALDCSDWVFLLRQKPESLAAASDGKRIFIDDSARELLMSVDTMQGKYSEIAVRGPGGLSVGRLIVDRFSEKLYSTQAGEFQYIRDAVARGMSIDQAVEELVRRAGER